MTVGEKIKKLVEDNDRTLSWLAKQVEMSRSGFNSMLDTDSIKVSTLKKIAEVFKVPIDYFFSDEAEILKGKLINTLVAQKHYDWVIRLFQLTALFAIDQLEQLIRTNSQIDLENLRAILSEIKEAYSNAEKFMLKYYSDEQLEILKNFSQEMRQIADDIARTNKEYSNEDAKQMAQSLFAKLDAARKK